MREYRDRLLATYLETPISLPREDDAAHDAYFGIGRVDGDRPSVLLRTTIEGRLLLVEKALNLSVDDADVSTHVIDASFADLLGALLGKTSRAAFRVSVGETGEVPVLDAMARWVNGHQLFAILTQGLIFSMSSMAHAIRVGKTDSILEYADLSISLLRGAAETFRFTGHFAADEYEAVIRPSMMPPMTPLCLSGLMSIDHRFLVQLLRTMRPALKQLRDLAPDRHEALAGTLGEVYDAHIHVCERFVGDKPSIRTAESTDTSGPALLENFRKLRLKPFEHA